MTAVQNASAIDFSDYANISSGSGYTENYKPHITVVSSNMLGVTWIGKREEAVRTLKKNGNSNETTAQISYEYRTILRIKDSGGWNSFYKYGDNVDSPIFRWFDGGGALAWSQEVFGPDEVYFIEGLYDTPQKMQATGRDIQLCEGSDNNSMYAMTIEKVNLPYEFTKSNSLGSFSKTNTTIINQGREGIVSNENAEFYFMFGDIRVNDTKVDFVSSNDTISNIENLDELNSYLRTESFNLKSSDNLEFSVLYGMVDSVEAAEQLSSNKYVTFRVELVEETTGEVLGVYDEVTYDKNNLYTHGSMGYSVDTEGIGNKNVRIRLVAEENLEGNYSLANLTATQSLLGKNASIKEVSYQGMLEVKDYALAQNYPNPFNPTTKINYMLPQAGKVSLKVYDALGREVMTLVDAHKEKGRYDAEFNAENLSSGVYIYRLKVNDFVQSRKMLLLK